MTRLPVGLSAHAQGTLANEKTESARVASLPPPLFQGIRNPAVKVPSFPGGCRRWRRDRYRLCAGRSGVGPGGVETGPGLDLFPLVSVLWNLRSTTEQNRKLSG